MTYQIKSMKFSLSFRNPILILMKISQMTTMVVCIIILQAGNCVQQWNQNQQIMIDWVAITEMSLWLTLNNNPRRLQTKLFGINQKLPQSIPEQDQKNWIDDHLGKKRVPRGPSVWSKPISSTELQKIGK
ncbi:hypothetical protein JTB14_020542 [Gonioctena quinquepunctata]|nr:hypothetical protein JTB14_020542 [Gonioctena quinquepunctata]